MSAACFFRVLYHRSYVGVNELLGYVYMLDDLVKTLHRIDGDGIFEERVKVPDYLNTP